MRLLKKKKLIKIIFAVVVSFIAVCFVYLNDYYHADMVSIEAFSYSNDVEMLHLENGNIIFGNEKSDSGLIFYQGAKVESMSYIPLMKEIASDDIFCVLVDMPFNMAVFDYDIAEDIMKSYPEIKNWYIGGHSQGGAMAAYYAAENYDKINGLVLLGSYSTKDLSETGISVLSVFGSEDEVINKEIYDNNKKNLPDDFNEIIIDGGCHAYFGVYGEQKGDGKANITNEEQIKITASYITEMIKD